MAVIALSGTKRYLRNFNWPLGVAAVGISLIGIVCVRSAGLHTPGAAGEFQKQILYLLLGVPAMLAISLVDYRTWQRWALALYVINVLLLLFILRGGHS